MQKMVELVVKQTHKYTDAMARNVVQLYAAGVSLEDIAKEYDGTPDTVLTILQWSKSMAPFSKALIAARPVFALIHAERTLSAHETNRDPQMARLQIQSAQWLASKYDPKVYGETLAIEIEHKIDLTQAIEDARQRTMAINAPIVEHDEIFD